MTRRLPSSSAFYQYTVLRVYARAGETIQMGSNAMQSTPSTVDNILVYPPGTTFASSTDPSQKAVLGTDPMFANDIFDCNTDDPGTGLIASRAQELAGPAPSPGGYTPCEFVAPADGIYPIIMLGRTFIGSPLTTGTVANPTVALNAAALSIWDVTVRDAAGVVQSGRLFSNLLNPIATGTPVSDVTGFVYTPAGYVYRVQLFDNRGVAWDIAADGAGVVDAGSGQPIFASFQWGLDDTGYPVGGPAHTEAVGPLGAPDAGVDSRYPAFFRPPDPVAISGPGGLGDTRGYVAAPIAPSGGLSAYVGFAGSGGTQNVTPEAAGGTISIDAPAALDGRAYDVTIDLDRNGSFGGGIDGTDAGTLTGAGNAFTWNGRDASGATVPCGSYAYQLRSSLPALHLVQGDTENTNGIQIERLSLPGDPALPDPLAASYDDVDPYKSTAITNTSPTEVTNATSGPGFHAWTASTGHTDLIDTWADGAQVTGSGTLQVLCPGEVSVDKRASDGRVVVGSTVSYRLVVKNNSAGRADGVVVEDRVPSKLDVRSASSTQGDCTVAGNRVRCELGTLAAGQEATVTIRAVATEAGQSTNTGVVVADRCPPEGCDTDPAKVTIVKPKLRLSKVAGQGRVRAGGIVTYAIRVTNPSKRSVRNVRTCDHLPAGLVALKASPKVRVSEGRYCWTAKRLGAGKSKRYEITVRALPGAAGRTVNRATATGGGVRGTSRAARAVRVLPRQAPGGGVTG